MTKIAVTGHRLKKVGFANEARLVDFAHDKVPVLLDDYPDGYFVVGGAQGWDQAVATACLSIGIPYEFHLPSRQISERWSKTAKQHYHVLLRGARDIRYIHPGPEPLSNSAFTSALHARNRTIINGSSVVLALFDGQRNGGTWNALQYAHSLTPRPDIKNAWASWLRFSGATDHPAPHVQSFRTPYTRPKTA